MNKLKRYSRNNFDTAGCDNIHYIITTALFSGDNSLMANLLAYYKSKH